jgi:hypothetical protein
MRGQLQGVEYEGLVVAADEVDVGAWRPSKLAEHGAGNGDGDVAADEDELDGLAVRSFWSIHGY